jgi:hypothetical protein
MIDRWSGTARRVWSVHLISWDVRQWPDAGVSTSDQHQRANREGFLLTRHVRWVLIGRRTESGQYQRLLLTQFTTDQSVRSPWPARPVTPKIAELASNRYVLSEGVEILIPLVHGRSLAHLFSWETPFWSIRECKSLLGWLKYKNPRLRTSLVHRE